MSPQQSEIEALERAITVQASEEASHIRTDAQAQASSIRRQAEADVEAARATILQRARREETVTREHAITSGRLEAQAVRLKRRELLLNRVLVEAKRQLALAAQHPDFERVARHLVREGVAHMGTADIQVRADEGTQRVLSADVLADLGQELGVRLSIGEALGSGTGVVLVTPDGHQRYDNTLEMRLARLQEELRAPIYRILRGEAP